MAAPTRSSNRDALLKIFKEITPKQNWRLLEVGTGSGHHATYIAQHLTDLQWVTSDIAVRHVSIKKTLKTAKLANVHGPILFEVGKDEFPSQKFNAVFAAQVLHVLTWKQTKSLIKMMGGRLRKGSQVLFYGPFKYDGKFGSQRFEELDQSLKQANEQHGIRSYEDVLNAMTKAGFLLKRDYALADANHLLFFERLEHSEKE